MCKALLAVGTLVRVTRDLHAYPVPLGSLGTIIACRGPYRFAWHVAPVQVYVVRFPHPHAYGDTLVLNETEIEPAD